MTDQIFLNKQRVLDKVKVLDKEFDFILIEGAGEPYQYMKVQMIST